MERCLIVVGDYHTVECAVRADGSSPARTFLDQLKRGIWSEDPDSDDLPDDEQIRDYDKLLDSVREMASNGLPEHGRAINYLDEGVWEFKIARKRLSFFDTDGTGRDQPHPRITDIADSPAPTDPQFWWLPELDRYLRLGSAFPKLGPTTQQSHLVDAIATRREDLAHDRA